MHVSSIVSMDLAVLLARDTGTKVDQLVVHLARMIQMAD